MKSKGKTALSVAGIILSIGLLVISTILAEEKIINSIAAIALIAVSAIFVLVAIFYAARVDYETSVYECRKCDYAFKPSFKAYIAGAHTLKTRVLKCPRCKEKSWCKRKSIEKEKKHG